MKNLHGIPIRKPGLACHSRRPSCGGYEGSCSASGEAIQMCASYTWNPISKRSVCKYPYKVR